MRMRSAGCNLLSGRSSEPLQHVQAAGECAEEELSALL